MEYSPPYIYLGLYEEENEATTRRQVEVVEVRRRELQRESSYAIDLQSAHKRARAMQNQIDALNCMPSLASMTQSHLNRVYSTATGPRLWQELLGAAVLFGPHPRRF